MFLVSISLPSWVTYYAHVYLAGQHFCSWIWPFHAHTGPGVHLFNPVEICNIFFRAVANFVGCSFCCYKRRILDCLLEQPFLYLSNSVATPFFVSFQFCCSCIFLISRFQYLLPVWLTHFDGKWQWWSICICICICICVCIPICICTQRHVSVYLHLPISYCIYSNILASMVE